MTDEQKPVEQVATPRVSALRAEFNADWNREVLEDARACSMAAAHCDKAMALADKLERELTAAHLDRQRYQQGMASLRVIWWEKDEGQVGVSVDWGNGQQAAWRVPDVLGLAAESLVSAAPPGSHWLIFFEDQDMRPEIFTDEVAARKRYADLLSNWSCHLFVIAARPVAAPLREALAELVRLKAIKDELDAIPDHRATPEQYRKMRAYQHDKPLAWDRARALLEETPKCE